MPHQISSGNSKGGALPWSTTKNLTWTHLLSQMHWEKEESLCCLKVERESAELGLRKRDAYRLGGHNRGRRGWDELGELHWNIHITRCKIDSQWEFAVWRRELKPNALWQPRGAGWGGRWEGGSGGRGHTYTSGWLMMYGRNQHNYKPIIFQLKINKF